MICINCKGKRKITGPRYLPPVVWETKDCPTCEGTGEIDPRYRNWKICRDCKGWGIETPLVLGVDDERCNGLGITRSA